MNAKYNITEIDLWEKDATLEIGGYKIYLQFDGDEPTLDDAIKYLVTERNSISSKGSAMKPLRSSSKISFRCTS